MLGAYKTSVMMKIAHTTEQSIQKDRRMLPDDVDSSCFVMALFAVQ
jgi:hypothetical protein